MKIADVKKVMVVGAGAMGRQIAMNCLLNGRAHGYQVTLCDTFPAAIESATSWARDYLMGRVEKGRITEEEREMLAARWKVTNDIAEAAKDADVVIEAIIEKIEAKRELFAQISKLTKTDTLLATNSSNIVSSKLADVTVHPERLCNMHYFNPALVMKLVEVVKGPHTSDDTVALAKAFAVNTGKAPIQINKEIAGFVANRINAAVTYEALSLLEKGIATVEDIDIACEKGLNYPMGPFRLMDLTGIDVNYYVRVDRFAESKDERDAPNPLVMEKVKKGEFGRKSGKGWYEYPKK